MSEYRHRAPQKPRPPRDFQFLEEPPGLIRRVLIFILLLAAAAWCVGTFAGCARPSKALQTEASRVRLAWSVAVHSLLCDHYRDRDAAGLCDVQPDGSLASVKVRWLALCTPEPPPSIVEPCRWIGDDIAALEREVPE